MRIFYYFLFYVLFSNYNAKGSENEEIKSKKPLPYFRRKVEELSEDSYPKLRTEDPNSVLVSFLIKNVKEIFNEIDDHTPYIDTSVLKYGSTTIYQTTIGSTSKNCSINIPSHTPAVRTDDVMQYANLTLTPLPPLIGYKRERQLSTRTKDETNILLRSKYSIIIEDVHNDTFNIAELFNSTVTTTTESVTETTEMYTPLSCITCNNVNHASCSDPSHKLIPSTVCDYKDELCYSLHTPFGIVERGCYSINNNMSTYVCSCNLCNYLAISELPYLFSKKNEWIDNFIELSRTKSLRKSVFKEMSCLKCEVNATDKKEKDLLDDANCLEGNIGVLTTQECRENEICAVKTIRSQGYLWRGCVSNPLYNYWLTLCDTDLCNYDRLVSIFDTD